MAEKLIIYNRQSPGDYVVMTAAVRDLMRCYPGKYQVRMDVMQPAVAQANPYLSEFFHDKTVRTVRGRYDTGPYSIHKSFDNKNHFLLGYIGALNEELRLNIKLTEFRPALYLTEEEKKKRIIDEPYWVFASGGKRDFTAKWWDVGSWQKVADLTKGKYKLVQVGGSSHVHPIISGTTDLVNMTPFRDLMRLIYHSQGVVCIVTCLMHIAAAFNKPCVVVAGGREPDWWEAYTAENRLRNMRIGDPTWNPPANDDFIPHRYLHTMGQLDCCKNKGCWVNHPLEGDRHCRYPIERNKQTIPKCLSMITPEMVVENMDWYKSQGII